MPGWFKPLRGKAHEYQILGFDVEGDGSVEGFVCGAIVGEFVAEFHTDRAQMWLALLHYGAQGFLMYAHNLQYDLPILEGDQFPSGKMTFTRYSMLWAKYKFHGHQARFYDSANLFPRHKLAHIGDLVNLDKSKIDPLVLDMLQKGAPWNSFLPSQQEKIRKYVERDAEIVYKGVAMLQELALELGGQLRATISGVAMDVYRRKYHKWPWRVLGPQTNKAIRPAYYGGRVENFVIGQVENVNMYDVTSLYPSVQREISYPHPSKLRLVLEPKLSGDWINWEGIAHATITVPETFIPLMPYRHTKRLFFPCGELEGSWTILELRRAIEAGATIERLDWMIGSETVFNPFRDFVDGLFDLRDFYLAEDMGVANILKLILNSLYGRWGVNPEGGLYELVNIEHETDLTGFQGFTTHDINGVLFAYGKIDGLRPPDYMNVFLAAQISAAGRIFLFDELERQGEDAIYCDTDSIITRGEIKTGSGLGGWRSQMEAGQADLIGPKEYALHNRRLGSVYRAKGIPAKLASEYFQTGAVRFFRALPIREAIAKGERPSTWVETLRSSNLVVPKRWPLGDLALQPGGYCLTRPYFQGELAGLISPGAPPVEIEPLFLEKVYPPVSLPLQPALLPKD